MRLATDKAGFRAGKNALIRAATIPAAAVPPCPDLTVVDPRQVSVWIQWLRDVWAVSPVAEAIGHASPVLAQRIAHLMLAGGGVRETYRATLATMRYVRRMAGRATPLGLFAGVATVDFGSPTHVRWGTDHHVLASPAASWPKP